MHRVSVTLSRFEFRGFISIEAAEEEDEEKDEDAISVCSLSE